MYKNITVKLTTNNIRQVSAILPAEPCQFNDWASVKKLNHADPNFWKPQQIDLLVGAVYYEEIIKPNIIRGPPSQPIAHLTIFG